MAVRYVKDFEFPAAAGYTKSAPSKVTGQMYAKGGDVKAPKGKGMMIMIGIGTPKKGPIKKAEGGAISDSDRRMLEQMSGDANATTEAERIMGQGSVSDYDRRVMQRTQKKPAPKKGSPYVPNSNIPAEGIYSDADMKRLERGYAKGGKAKMDKKIGKVMHEFKAGELHSGSKKGAMVKNAKQALAIAMSEGKKAMKKNHGGEVHDGVMEDKALIKKMIKPAALKGKAQGGAAMGQAVQMAKTNAIEKSLKGQKKTAFADGGMAGMAGAPRVPSPLQRMAMMQRAKSVPVAPAGPMIAPGMSPDSRVGVGQMRPGSKPDIGAIRAAMARAATRANPDMAPSAMKKGGKVKMDNC